MNSVTWTDIGTFAAAVGTMLVLFAALTIARKQVQAARTATQAQAMADLSRRWDDPAFAESRRKAEAIGDSKKLKEAVKTSFQEDSARYGELIMIPTFFEEVGIRVKHGLVTLELVRDLLGLSCVRSWQGWEPTVMYLREEVGDDAIFEHFEQLASSLTEDASSP